MFKGQLFAVYPPGKDFDRLLQGEGGKVHLREIGHPRTQATGFPQVPHRLHTQSQYLRPNHIGGECIRAGNHQSRLGSIAASC